MLSKERYHANEQGRPDALGGFKFADQCRTSFFDRAYFFGEIEPLQNQQGNSPTVDRIKCRIK